VLLCAKSGTSRRANREPAHERRRGASSRVQAHDARSCGGARPPRRSAPRRQSAVARAAAMSTNGSAPLVTPRRFMLGSHCVLVAKSTMCSRCHYRLEASHLEPQLVGTPRRRAVLSHRRSRRQCETDEQDQRTRHLTASPPRSRRAAPPAATKVEDRVHGSEGPHARRDRPPGWLGTESPSRLPAQTAPATYVERAPRVAGRRGDEILHPPGRSRARRCVTPLESSVTTSLMRSPPQPSTVDRVPTGYRPPRPSTIG
jgi:hypothetical protein